MKTVKVATNRSEKELEAEQRKILDQVAEIDADPAKIGERHAGELAADAPNEQRISELEEKRDRLARERERLVGRSRAIGDLAIPAALREATRITMGARLKEYDRQRALIVQSHAAVRGAVEALREVKAEIPWEHPHPEFLLRQLKEEIGFDASELGEKPPALEPAPFMFAELEELVSLAREIAGRVEYQHAGHGARLTKRGKVAQARKRNEAAASMGMHLPHPDLGV